MNFKDNFSGQSEIYVKFRPHYPRELFSFLASLTHDHDLVWDCGTGNGQAAKDLADYYKTVIATDPSENQIKHAYQVSNVIYRVEKAEHSSLPSNSADLITVSNALHWFNLDEFYTEVKRVIKPNGIIAAWAYGLPVIDPETDKIIKRYHDIILDKYWLPENRLVEQGYKTLSFPYEIIPAPEFCYEKEFSLEDVKGYLETWSATQRFIRENAYDPTDQVINDLQSVWKKGEIKILGWKLILKTGRGRIN